MLTLLDSGGNRFRRTVDSAPCGSHPSSSCGAGGNRIDGPRVSVGEVGVDSPRLEGFDEPLSGAMFCELEWLTERKAGYGKVEKLTGR